ncbi:hypothetical protein EDB89DRAFT_1909493 [Lactarius sanguifluus]|nr:hypothetical protein EDB89DRAFT_1909493 [Lactarius sanguifluus]
MYTTRNTRPQGLLSETPSRRMPGCCRQGRAASSSLSLSLSSGVVVGGCLVVAPLLCHPSSWSTGIGEPPVVVVESSKVSPPPAAILLSLLVVVSWFRLLPAVGVMRLGIVVVVAPVLQRASPRAGPLQKTTTAVAATNSPPGGANTATLPTTTRMPGRQTVTTRQGRFADAAPRRTHDNDVCWPPQQRDKGDNNSGRKANPNDDDDDAQQTTTVAT